MLSIRTLVFALLVLAPAMWARETEPCEQTSSVSDAHLSVAFKGGGNVFQEGEIIPLVLSFTATKKNHYWADARKYDRSGRLTIEYYCLEPQAPDPLESYFNFGTFMAGGLGSEQELSAKPFIAEANLNEWRTPGPGHYRLYVVSARVWRVPEAREQVPYSRLDEVLRSNAVSFEVRPATSKWQSEQLSSAVKTLPGLSSEEDARQQSAIDALDGADSRVVQDAAEALGQWGTAEAEAPLWSRLQRLQQQWAGREGELRATPDLQNPSSQAVTLEVALVTAIAQGRAWLCASDKLARLAELSLTPQRRKEVEQWIEEWKGGSAVINPMWSAGDGPTFSLFQYASLSETQLSAKLAQFPSGKQFSWLFLKPGQIMPALSMEAHEKVYERVRAVAEQHGIVIKRRINRSNIEGCGLLSPFPTPG